MQRRKNTVRKIRGRGDEALLTLAPNLSNNNYYFKEWKRLFSSPVESLSEDLSNSRLRNSSDESRHRDDAANEPECNTGDNHRNVKRRTHVCVLGNLFKNKTKAILQ